MIRSIVAAGALLLAVLGPADTRAAERLLPLGGATISGSIEPGEPHAFRVSLSAGQFLEIEVRQQDVDLVVGTYDPRGMPLLEFDSAVGENGPEPAYVVAELDGEHRVELRVFAGDTRGGGYEIRVAELRDSAPADATRMRAERAFADGIALRKQRTEESRRRGIERFDEALPLFRELADDRRVADTLTYLGGLHQALRESRQALEYYRPAVPLLEATGQQRRVAVTRMNIGWCHDNLGAYQSALQAYGEALAIMEEQRSDGGRATLLASIGLVYQALGDTEGALREHRRALELWRGLGSRHGEGIALRDIGLAYERGGVPERALAHLEEALVVCRETGSRRREGQTLRDLARVQRLLGGVDAALDGLETALPIFRELGDRRGEARTLIELGRVRAELGGEEIALADLQRAVDLAGEIEDPSTLAQALAALARVERARGETRRALDRIEAAVAVVESVRAGVQREDLRSSHLASSQPYYELYVELLMELDDSGAGGSLAAEALHVAERGRARSMAEGVARATLPGDGEDAELRNPKAPELAEIQSLLDGSSALVAYKATGDDLLAFIVTADGLAVRRLHLDARQLAERAANFVDILSVADSRWRPVARRLGLDLVAPWLDSLSPDVTDLIIVPDGILHYVPFEALILGESDDDLLLRRFTVSYAPSATVLAQLRGRPAPQTSPASLLVFADPELPQDDDPGGGGPGMRTARSIYEQEGFAITPLPFSAIEAQAIRNRVAAPVTVHAGAAASESRLRDAAASEAPVLHFATHGLVSQWSPELSALVLTPGGEGDDGFLQAREIYGLRLNSEMVVLSACQTARGRLLAGEGVQGLVRAFFYAGARSVVASLWNVQDDHTAGFMDHFYLHLSRGATKAEALRRAKLDLLDDEATAAPRFWAPFVLIGEGEGSLPRLGSRSRASWTDRAPLLPLGLVALVAMLIGARFMARRLRS